MATVTLSPPRTRRSIPVRIAFVVLLVLALSILSAVVWFYWAARSSLPQVEGSLKVPGLKAKVTVLRDAQGMPHIRAASLEDAIFTQGYGKWI